ncbi:MAG: GIY-YIG nuclease family protein [Polaromonas sp.]
MLVFDFLRLLDQRIEPSLCKVHLATHNGIEDPFQVYLTGGFDEWQARQARKNFPRQYVVSLVQLKEKNHWLYVGTYESFGCVQHPSEGVVYKLKPLEYSMEFAGKLTGTFERPGRQPYLNGELVAPQFHLYELSPQKRQLEDFPGFKKVNLSFSDLSLIVRQHIPSWRAALENAAGVYLISDEHDGKLYVGSATGEGGIWARWCEYLNGHGENVNLRKLIKDAGLTRASSFHFSILEIADTHTSKADILTREAHWKDVLLSRLHGLNGN